MGIGDRAERMNFAGVGAPQLGGHTPDGWLRTHSYGSLREKGLDAIRKCADLIKYDDHELLATEFAFVLPVLGTWDFELKESHILADGVDRGRVRRSCV